MDFADEAAWIEEEEAAEEEARKRARIEVEFPPFILSFDTYLSSNYFLIVCFIFIVIGKCSGNL
jgi:hypothetical protein